MVNTSRIQWNCLEVVILFCIELYFCTLQVFCKYIIVSSFVFLGDFFVWEHVCLCIDMFVCVCVLFFDSFAKILSLSGFLSSTVSWISVISWTRLAHWKRGHLFQQNHSSLSQLSSDLTELMVAILKNPDENIQAQPRWKNPCDKIHGQ